MSCRGATGGPGTVGAEAQAKCDVGVRRRQGVGVGGAQGTWPGGRKQGEHGSGNSPWSQKPRGRRASPRCVVGPTPQRVLRGPAGSARQRNSDTCVFGSPPATPSSSHRLPGTLAPKRKLNARCPRALELGFPASESENQQQPQMRQRWNQRWAPRPASLAPAPEEDGVGWLSRSSLCELGARRRRKMGFRRERDRNTPGRRRRGLSRGLRPRRWRPWFKSQDHTEDWRFI